MKVPEAYLAFRARVAQLLAELPPHQAKEVRCLFDEFVDFNAELLKVLNQAMLGQERELRMWRRAEADWWQSRVSRETALFEDRLEMTQPTLGTEMMERLTT